MTRISKTFWFGFGAAAALLALVAAPFVGDYEREDERRRKLDEQ